MLPLSLGIKHHQSFSVLFLTCKICKRHHGKKLVFLKKNLDVLFYIVYIFMAAVDLLCLSLVVASSSYSLVAVHGLLIAVASLVVEHRLLGMQAQ